MKLLILVLFLMWLIGEVRFSWDRHPFASRYALYSDVEGDSVRLRVEYSVYGVDWNWASIVGDTLIGRSRYSGYLIFMMME